MSRVPFDDFSGLDLVSSPDSSQCIDALNVDLDVRGAVRSRDGFNNFTASAAASRLTNVAPFYTTNGTQQVMAVSEAGNFYRAYDSSGGVIASQAVTNGAGRNEVDFTRFGGPSAEVVYASGWGTFPTVGAVPYKWNGAAWAGAAGIALGGVNPYQLALKATDNRLVGAFVTSNSSRVGFSNAGVPETWGANNYVDLTPGDGERITAIKSWREMVFVFKETKYFVFGNTSTDGTGNPVFNYRPVDVGVGALGRQCAVSTPNGVYFLSRRGIYRTTGGDPQLVSAAIDPIFRGGAQSFYQGGVLNHAVVGLSQMAWHDERLYVAFPSGTSTANDRLLVYSPADNYWMIWDVAVNSLMSFLSISGPSTLVFAYAAGANHIGRLSNAYTTDGGTAIASRYRTGFYDLGSEEEKRIRNVTMWGTGSPSYSFSRNFGALGATQAVTLGTDPAIVRGDLNAGLVGTVFSHQLEGTSPWRVHRLSQDLVSQKGRGEKTP